MALGPDQRPTGQISQAAQAALGFPPNFQRASPFPFAGMNQTDDRSGLQDQEFYWIENLFKTGQGRLRALWDVGTPLYTVSAGRSIVAFFWFNIGPINYCAVFLDNGTAVQVQESSGAITTISAVPNTFYVGGGSLPACCATGGQYLLIGNNNTANDYWIWDGAALYGAGTIAPVIVITDGGSGYTSLPTVTPYGGSGSGIVVTPTITNGSVTSLTVNNPGTGYQPGDVVQFQFSGGGSDTAAKLTASIAAGGVESVIITVGGAGYGSVPAVGFTGGGGSGAAGTAVLTGGVVTSIIIDDPGSGYTGNPTVSFTGGSPSTPASAYSTITAGVLTGIFIDNGGTGYTSTPLLTITGGSGSGATAVVSAVVAGVITTVDVTAGGAGYTTTPAVEIGGGANKAAQASASMMPYGISGNYIETYQSRVWISHPHKGTGAKPSGGVFNVSAPASLTDFATSDGGNDFVSSDRFLRYQYTVMRQANGYLYAIGDSGISVISNVQTTGSPPTTSMNYQSADPQVGTVWPNSVADFGRTILFANQTGVYGIYGGSAVKVSAKLDRLFETVITPDNPDHNPNNLPCVTPSASAAYLFNRRVYVLNITILDPFTKTPRTVQLIWDEKEWFVASSAKSIMFVNGLERQSDIDCYGTDGSKLYYMFSQPSSATAKFLVSKYWGAERIEIIRQALTWYVAGRDLSAAQAGVTLYWVTDYAASQSEDLPGEGVNPSPNGATTLGGSGQGVALTGGNTGDVVAPLLGFKVTTTAPDFEITNAVMGMIPITGIYG